MDTSQHLRREPRVPVALAKTALRDQLLTARDRRGLAEVGRRGGAHRRAPARPPGGTPGGHAWRRTSRSGSEPGTGVLLDALRAAGKRVVLPVLPSPTSTSTGPSYDGPGVAGPGAVGLLEPTGPRLGCDAVGDRRRRAGARAGRVDDRHPAGPRRRLLRPGAGRVPVGTFTCVLLYDDEVGVDRAGRAARPSGDPRRHPWTASIRLPLAPRAGAGCSTSSPASLTASLRPRPRQRLAGDEEVGLVDVVAAARVARDAGEVDPARVVEVGQRDHHPHRRRRRDVVALGARPRWSRRRCCRRRRRDSRSRLTSASTRPDARLAERARRPGRAGAACPTSSRRGPATAGGSARRGRRASPGAGCRRGSRPRRRWCGRPTTGRAGGRAAGSPPRTSARRRRATATRAARRGRSARSRLAPHRVVVRRRGAVGAGWRPSQSRSRSCPSRKYADPRSPTSSR